MEVSLNGHVSTRRPVNLALVATWPPERFQSRILDARADIPLVSFRPPVTGRSAVRVNSIHPAGVDTPMIRGEAVRAYLETYARESVHRKAIPVPAIETSDVAD